MLEGLRGWLAMWVVITHLFQFSGHPLLGRTPWFVHMLGGRFGMTVEFLMLLGAMLMVDAGALGWAWGYAFYSGVNGLAAWLILSDRV